MTRDAQEVFTVELARAAAKTTNKFLRARGLQRADREDVTAAALEWCWKNRAKYSLTTTLETWFMNAVRDAYKNLQRDELPSAEESIDNIGGTDTTYEEVAAESSAKVLLDALTPAYREIAVLTMEGYTYRELIKKGYPERTIKDAHKRIKQLRRLVPDGYRSKRMIQTAAAPSSDDAVASIDTELEQLDFAPAAGKECPPCWRCLWFEGFMPSGKRETRMDIEDEEVRLAVKNTEARKVEIAQQVRDGVI
jgi:DNA-directed RNA polymerase specialized sigma24 family protein